MNKEKYTLQEVTTPALEREWLVFPEKIYKGNRNWVRPLDVDVLKVFDPSKNELFAAGEAIRWMVRDTRGEVVGRIAAFYNREKAAIEEQLPKLRREEIARASIATNGKIIVADNLDTAVEIANEIAPEHQEACVDQPFDYLDKSKNAGSIFLGRNCPEALGDYFAGPNHTLPTSGTARFSSPLGVDDFVKKSSFIYYTREALEKAAPRIADFAEREGLHAHARSVTIRYE